jgi:hypothetical protein
MPIEEENRALYSLCPSQIIRSLQMRQPVLCRVASAKENPIFEASTLSFSKPRAYLSARSWQSSLLVSENAAPLEWL